MVLIDTGNRTKVIFEALHATNLEAKKMTVHSDTSENFMGKEVQSQSYFPKMMGVDYHVAIVDHSTRSVVITGLVSSGASINSATHPRVIISPTASNGNGSHVASGTKFCSSVSIGNRLLTKTNATILSRIKVDDNDIADARSLVTKDIEAGKF